MSQRARKPSGPTEAEPSRWIWAYDFHGPEGLTVALAGIDLGRWILVSALGIASVKTILVLNIFMHLKFEDSLFRWFVGVALLILGIFFALTFFDYAFH